MKSLSKKTSEIWKTTPSGNLDKLPVCPGEEKVKIKLNWTKYKTCALSDNYQLKWSADSLLVDLKLFLGTISRNHILQDLPFECHATLINQPQISAENFQSA